MIFLVVDFFFSYFVRPYCSDMFKKPIKVIGNTKLKKALLKKVRISAEKSFDGFRDLPDEEVAKLIPNKTEAFEITKLKGSRVGYYSYKDVPVFIDSSGV